MFYAEHYSEIKEQDVKIDGARNVKIRWLVDESKGAPNFAMRLFDIDVNGNTPYHTHDWEHEIFVVSGKGKLLFEGKEYPLKPGSTAFIPANAEHNFVNTSNDEILKMICIVPNQK